MGLFGLFGKNNSASADVVDTKIEITPLDNVVSGDIVAAISAAVAMMMGGKPFAVRSIRRAGNRSVWAKAGISQNTRPF